MPVSLNKLKDYLLKNSQIGNHPTVIDDLRIAERIKVTDFIPCFYGSYAIMVLGGKKEVIFGQEKISYESGDCVICSTDVPVSSRIVKASADDPFLVLMIKLDQAIISELILECNIKVGSVNNLKAISVEKASDDLVDTIYRYASLITKTPNERQILEPLIKREFHYKMLLSDFGKELALIYSKDTQQHCIHKAIQELKLQFRDKINMGDLAKRVNMSVSTFYRKFKEVANVSPLQYQKLLRLNEARRLLLTGNYDVTKACIEVGYESPTQFIREYKGVFGAPPKTDVKRILAFEA